MKVNHLTVNEVFGPTFQGEGRYVGRACAFLRLAYCNLSCSWCWGWFHNNGRQPTVTMAKGNKKKLGKVKIGDRLLTLNEKGRLTETTVTDIIRRNVDQWMRLKIEGKYYYVTPEHPLFTLRGLVKALNLKIGDNILHTNRHDIVSYKKRFNNPMHNRGSVEKRLESVDYDMVGKKISRTIKRKKEAGTYIPSISTLSNENLELMRRKSSYQKMGKRNPNYDEQASNRNYYDLKKKVGQGRCRCKKCNSLERLEVHHIDHNNTNDIKSNLTVLCKSCHTKEHNKYLNFHWQRERLAAKNGMKVEQIQYVDRLSKPPSLRGRRLPVVNLTCKPYPTYLADNMWSHNCDTPYTWNWIGTDFAHPEKYDKVKETNVMSNAEIVVRVAKFGVNHLVISGGEPLLQQTRLIPFLRMLKASGNYFVEVETNGTIMPTREFLSWIDQINCSPKLSNSGDATHLRIKPRVLEQLAQMDKVDFKFVVGSEPNEIGEVIGFIELFKLPRHRIWLMPLGKTMEELELTSTKVERLAWKQGFKFSPRLQIETYGDKRGV